MKIKKFWVFDLVKDKNENPCDRMYAVAYDKATRDLFIELRNMKYFKCRRYDSLDDFKRVRPREVERLQQNKLYLGKIRTMGDFGNTTIEILLTWEEESAIALWYDRSMKKIINKPLVNPALFKKNYFRALKQIGYTETYKFKKKLPIELEYYIPDMSDYNKKLDVVVDEFRVFMKLFGWTMGG